MPSGRVSARRAYPGRRERGEPGNLPLLAGRPGSTRWTRASMASAKGGQRDAVANFPHDPRPVTTPSRSPASIRRPSDPVVDAYPKVLKPPTVTVPELKRTGVGTTATRHPGEWDQARPKHPFTYQLQVGIVAIPERDPSTSRPQGPAPSLDLPRRAVSPRSALLPL